MYHINIHVGYIFITTTIYSDSSDGSEGDDVSEEESCISGGFINDGAYTQHESPGGVETQYGMYLAVNNYHMHMQSPEDLVRGRPNVAALVRRRARLSTSSPGSAGVVDTPDSSVLSSDASMLQDTPERERERHTETTARSTTAAVNRGISSKHGTGKSTKDSPIDSQGEGEAEFDYDLSAKPHRAQQSLPNRSTSAVGTGKENVGAKKSAPFWQKFRSNGNDKPASSKFVINSSSSEDSDNSSNDDGSSSSRRKKQKLSTEQNRLHSNTTSVATTSNVLGGKGLSGGVLHSRPPLAPAQHINCSPCPQQQHAGASKAKAQAVTVKTAVAVEEDQESSLFDWGF